MSASAPDLSVLRIRFWQHWRAVGQIYRDYPPGADVLVDHIRSSGFLRRFLLRSLVAPLYFASQQGWAVRGAHGEMAAIMYLRRGARQGIQVLHIDNITVNAHFRRLGLARRLFALAEELARAEQRPFLKLAVTVANSPAVTLYRQLGYQEQHHHFFTYAPPASTARHRSLSTDITLRRVRGGQAAKAFEQFYQLEVSARTPEVAGLLGAYYPQGDGLVGVHLPRTRAYVVEQSGQQIGYGDLYRQGTQWHVRLSLRPEWWGTESERQTLQLLTSAIGPEPGSALVLHVPSAAHFEALCAGAPALAHELGLMEQHSERMVMIKRLVLA